MDETVDKDKFKAAVFRRGNKQELLHPSTSGKHDGATVPYELTGDEKLDELLHLWSLSRSGFVCCPHYCMPCDMLFSWTRVFLQERPICGYMETIKMCCSSCDSKGKVICSCWKPLGWSSVFDY